MDATRESIYTVNSSRGGSVEAQRRGCPSPKDKFPDASIDQLLDQNRTATRVRRTLAHKSDHSTGRTRKARSPTDQPPATLIQSPPLRRKPIRSREGVGLNHGKGTVELPFWPRVSRLWKQTLRDRPQKVCKCLVRARIRYLPTRSFDDSGRGLWRGLGRRNLS